MALLEIPLSCFGFLHMIWASEFSLAPSFHEIDQSNTVARPFPVAPSCKDRLPITNSRLARVRKKFCEKSGMLGNDFRGMKNLMKNVNDSFEVDISMFKQFSLNVCRGGEMELLPHTSELMSRGNVWQ